MSSDRRQSVDFVAWTIAVFVAVYTICCRVAPYYLGQQSEDWLWPFWNFVPAGALALFAGSRLRSVGGVILPLATLFVSDLLLIRPLAAMGYPALSWGRVLIYACFIGYYGMGRLLPRLQFAPHGVALAAVCASFQFFMITNFAVWLGDRTLYTKDAVGLLNCYVAAIPFYRNTFAADVMFGLVLFGVHAVAVRMPSGIHEEQPA